MATTIQRSPFWALIVPVFSLLLLAGQLLPLGMSGWYSALLGTGLILSIIAAVHHAELLAYGIGEPLGTLVLALAITVIEVSLIVSVMLVTDGGAPVLALMPTL